MATDLLIREYQARCSRNASYSVRAFAKSLGVSHTLLSLVMNRKRSISPALLQKLKTQLPTLSSQIKKLDVSQPSRELSIDEFAPIANWLHYAILSLTRCKDFELDGAKIARTLGVNKLQAHAAIEDLKRFKLIAFDKTKKRWSQSTLNLLVNNTRPASSTREFIRSYLNKANTLLDFGNFEERDMRVMTFAMRRSDFEYARQELLKFRRQLSDDLEARGEADVVVALNTNLFALSGQAIH